MRENARVWEANEEREEKDDWNLKVDLMKKSMFGTQLNSESDNGKRWSGMNATTSIERD
jgi:hypothetical protein